MKASMTFEIPLDLPSVANLREGWKAKAKRTSAQRREVAIAWTIARGSEKGWPYWPAVVTLTRVSAGQLDEDNLATAFKAVQDEITRCMELPNDRDPRVRFVRKQERGVPKAPRLRVEVEGGADEANDPAEEHA